MDVYIYQAALVCEDCGEKIKRQLDARGIKDTGDSDAYPQGPYPDGGGEADTAQHCDACHVFLENRLTNYGAEDVKERIAEAIKEGKYNPVSLGTWADFYDVTLKELVEDGLLDLDDVIKLTKGYPKAKK